MDEIIGQLGIFQGLRNIYCFKRLLGGCVRMQQRDDEELQCKMLRARGMEKSVLLIKHAPI